MIALVLQPRLIENKDWATFLFLLALILVILAKSSYENRFNDFIKLFFSDKYIKIYKDSSHLLSFFNVFLFIVNIISLSFFIQLVFDHFGYGDKHDWILFIRIFTLLMVFVLSKFLIEKIMATTFGIEELIENFNLQKVSWRTFIGLLLLPITVVLYYANYATNSLFFSLIAILLVVNCVTYIISLRIYQNLLIANIFYFILYLCTFEIAPYYFIYYLIKKN